MLSSAPELARPPARSRSRPSPQQSSRSIHCHGEVADGYDKVLIGYDTELMPDELRAAIVLFFSFLDEQQRRLYAGLEALKTGRGGDGRIAELLGVDVGTVARGRRELLAQDVQADRGRRARGGRPALGKKLRKS